MTNSSIFRGSNFLCHRDQSEAITLIDVTRSGDIPAARVGSPGLTTYHSLRQNKGHQLFSVGADSKTLHIPGVTGRVVDMDIPLVLIGTGRIGPREALGCPRGPPFIIEENTLLSR